MCVCARVRVAGRTGCPSLIVRYRELLSYLITYPPNATVTRFHTYHCVSH